MAGINLLQNGNMKAIDFSPWGGIDGFLTATSGSSTTDYARLRMLVPWLNKAVNMTSNAVAQLPYCIEDASDAEIDKDIAWGGVRNPQTLLYLVSASLCSGAAYLIADTTSRAIVDLRYVAPNTMTPNFDSNGNLMSFRRQMQGGKSEMLSTEQVIYFWLPDDTVEIGPANIHPLGNAALPASLIAAMDNSLKIYGERGFIPPMILSVKGMPSKPEAEKAEAWWNRWLRGWDKTIAKFINADSVTPTAIGAGMEEMKGTYIEITTQQIKNIASAFNIPMSTFLSDESSYATAQSDQFLWYSSGEFVNIYQTVEDVLSSQLYARFGWDFEFELDKLAAFQTEVNDKAGSLSTLASVFTDNGDAAIIAADLLGVDLSDEQIMAIQALKKPEPAPVAQPEQSPEPLPAQTTAPMVQPTDEENQIASELMSWRKYAAKNHKREFDVKYIPPAMEAKIRAGLRAGGDIESVFDSAVIDMPVSLLARAIEKATEAARE